MTYRYSKLIVLILAQRAKNCCRFELSKQRHCVSVIDNSRNENVGKNVYSLSPHRRNENVKMNVRCYKNG